MYTTNNRFRVSLATVCAGVVTLGLVTASPHEASPVGVRAENHAVQLAAAIRPAVANAAVSAVASANIRVAAAAANPVVGQAATIERTITEGVATIVGVGLGLLVTPVWYLVILPAVLLILNFVPANTLPQLPEFVFNVVAAPFNWGFGIASSLFGLDGSPEASAAVGASLTPASQPGPAKPGVATAANQHSGPKAVLVHTVTKTRVVTTPASVKEKHATAAPASAEHVGTGKSAANTAVRAGSDRKVSSSRTK